MPESEEKRKISNNLSQYLIQTEKQEQIKPEIGGKKRIKLRIQINDPKTNSNKNQ